MSKIRPYVQLFLNCTSYSFFFYRSYCVNQGNSICADAYFFLLKGMLQSSVAGKEHRYTSSIQKFNPLPCKRYALMNSPP
jgi:hypothetical protein